MKTLFKLGWLCAFTAILCNACKEQPISAELLTEEIPSVDTSEKVILITLDGLRWQELFGGIDSLLLDSEYTKHKEAMREKFWANTLEQRRQKLMPFFWETIAAKGQLYGNRNYGNHVNLTNQMWFSYPGYNEILSGAADDARITSNEKFDNPNVTILETVNDIEGFKGKVGAFGSWDVFPFIINETRSGLYVNAGYRKAVNDVNAHEDYLNKLQDQAIQPWGSVRQDVFTHNYALEYIKKETPKLVYISYGETDDFAHDGDYDHYLLAAKNTDAMIKELWDFCQNDPNYKDKTTFVISTDHGRGTQPLETWQSHGKSIEGADETWIAVLGNKVSPKGEVKTEMQLHSNQLAATVLKLLGLPKTSETMGDDFLAQIQK